MVHLCCIGLNAAVSLFCEVLAQIKCRGVFALYVLSMPTASVACAAESSIVALLANNNTGLPIRSTVDHGKQCVS